LIAGRVAYKLHLGKPAADENLVSIFAEGPGLFPVTVELQERYMNDWLKSQKTGA
jgi:hypothetical protein